MEIVGYTDRFSVRQNEIIKFMVSCRLTQYEVRLVRLIHGDPRADGPGFKEEEIPASMSGTYPGREQLLHKGAYLHVADNPRLGNLDGLTVHFWLYATTPGKRKQGLFMKQQDAGNGGFGIWLADEGDIAFSVRDTAGVSHVVRTRVPLRPKTWYSVACRFDGSAQKISIVQEPVTRWPVSYDGTSVEARAPLAAIASEQAPIVMAACCRGTDTSPRHMYAHFNGKLDHPRLFNRRLSDAELVELRKGTPPGSALPNLLADWDFAADVAGSSVADSTANGMNAVVINMPARAMTGWNWSGRETDFRNAPNEYGAIYFHDDDLEDARWDCDFEFRVPEELHSGVYAAKLIAGDHYDYVPFFVRPGVDKATARILFLVPTLSYMAYGNEHLPSRPGRPEKLVGMSFDELMSLAAPYERACFMYMHDNDLHSLYDFHTDGSGVAYTTRLRPITNLRPLYSKPVMRFRATHQFNEDMYLIDWLIEKDYEFDVATDEDLHYEGRSLLDQYKVVMTGSHPEYWSLAMFDALEGYLGAGGRLMYLGGNGFYWVTSFDPKRPHVIEVRRHESGVRTWQADQGEYHHSTTGETGGLWRFRGKVPQRIVGVGMTATGGEPARPYRRQSDSHDPRAAFIFEGIGEREIIGDFGLHLGAAAGWELDRADAALGTPPHALVVASSFGHSDVYQLSIEDLWKTDPNVGGNRCPDVRADMVYVEYPNDGAVFSVGSISYVGSLSHNGYDNNVSRITANVLTAFSADTLPR